MREICEPHKVEQAVAAVMSADEERIRIARIKYCTRYEATPWKTFLCCALGRKHACEYIDEFPHIIEIFFSIRFISPTKSIITNIKTIYIIISKCICYPITIINP